MPNARARTASLLAKTAALEARGRALEALALLHTAPRINDDPSVERRLVQLRHRSFLELVRARGHCGVIARESHHQGERSLPIEPPPGTSSLNGLTPARLREQLYRHGCVLVRRMVPPHIVARLVETIDRAFAAYDAYANNCPDPGWFDPVLNISGGTEVRGWVRAAGGVLAADSPFALEILLDTYSDLGVERVVTEYFGERPAISADKTTLRRAAPSEAAGWHQDGRFLGTNIRSLNVWVALTDCGIDAPGLDIIPAYPGRILETGTGKASLDWTIDHDIVLREFGANAIWHPIFQAGDALLFDHMLVHRTACSPSMIRSRYALETWFFAPSAYPGSQTPLLV